MNPEGRCQQDCCQQGWCWGCCPPPHLPAIHAMITGLHCNNDVGEGLTSECPPEAESGIDCSFGGYSTRNCSQIEGRGYRGGAWPARPMGLPSGSAIVARMRVGPSGAGGSRI